MQMRVRLCGNEARNFDKAMQAASESTMLEAVRLIANNAALPCAALIWCAGWRFDLDVLPPFTVGDCCRAVVLSVHRSSDTPCRRAETVECNIFFTDKFCVRIVKILDDQAPPMPVKRARKKSRKKPVQDVQETQVVQEVQANECL
jgi:hypothetical protein